MVVVFEANCHDQQQFRRLSTNQEKRNNYISRDLYTEKSVMQATYSQCCE